MSPQSIPVFAMACIVFVIGVQNFTVFFHRPHSRVHLTFFLACLAIAFYQLACAYLYSASTTAEGQVGQRLQLIGTAVLSGLVPWFIVDYFRESRSVSRALWSFATAMSVLFLISAAAVAINPFDLFWAPTPAFPKNVNLPFGLRVVYNEASLGLFAGVQDLLTLVFFTVLIFSLLREYVRSRHHVMLPVLVVMAVILVCAVSDFLIAVGRLSFVYTSEYAVMGLALLISSTLTRGTLEAARVQAALKESEARYRGIFQNSAVSIWAEDITELRAYLRTLPLPGAGDLDAWFRERPDVVRTAIGCVRVDDVNDVTLGLFGAMSKEQFLGPLDRSLDERGVPLLAGTVAAVARGERSFELETTLPTATGRRLDVIISGWVPPADQPDQRMLVTLTDITARKRAQETFRSFIEQSSEAIFLADESGLIIEFNPAAESLTGYTRAEVVGTPVITLVARCIGPEELDRSRLESVRGQVEEALRSGSGKLLNRPLRGRLRRPDGSVRDFVQFVFPILSTRGYLLGSISHDVTDALRTEEELRRSQEQLRQAQKLEAIGTLAGGIAHDFNNLLTGILGSVSLIIDQLPDDSPLVNDARTVESSALRAAELASQILTFSRQEPRVEMTSLDPAEVIGEITRLLSRTIEKSITISVKLSRGLPHIRGNAGQVHQAILNLCLNARDAMPRGGMLTIAAAPVEEADRDCGRVAITVSDTGVGMSPQVQERMFEPFFTTKEKGRGLGLAMVYGIIRAHGGEITVQSEPNVGTTFRVVLPGAQAADASPAARPAAGARGGGETILVVDDELPVLRVVSRILGRAGYTVLTAEDGPAALALFADHRDEIHLILLDLSMPGMGGAEVLDAVRTIDPDARVVLSSGYSDDERVASILAKGGHSFLRKPYSMDKVLHAVRDALDAPRPLTGA